MGANLVTIVRNFSIHTQDFTNNDDGSPLDGCAAGGTHRILRSDSLSHNAGDADLHIGPPPPPPRHMAGGTLVLTTKGKLAIVMELKVCATGCSSA